MANICFMEKLLIRLIEEHDSIIIPDFGTLLKSGDKIIFNSFLKFNDGKLQKALSEEKGISLDEAKEEIQTLANRLASQAESGETAVIEGLGSFYKDSAGSIVFSGFTASQEAPVKPKEEKAEPVKEEKKDLPEKEEETPSNADKELDEALDNSNDEVEKEVPPAPVIEPKDEIENLEKEIEEVIKPKAEKPAKEKKEKKEKKKKPVESKEKKKEKKETPPPPVEDNSIDANKEDSKEPEALEEVKEESKEAPFFDKNDRLEEKVLDKIEDKEEPKQEVVSKAEAMAHVAPETDGHELPPVQAQPKKKKKKRFIWLVLLLLLIGGGVFAGLKWDMVSEWIGLNDTTEKKAEGKEKEPKKNDDNHEDELTEPVQDDVMIEETDSSEVIVDDENISEELEQADEEVVEEASPDPEPVVTEPAVTQNSGSSSGSHHVIAGAFTSKGNADALVTKLQGQGFSSARLLGRFNGEFYQVAAGSYNSASEANGQLSGVNAAIGGGAWVLVKDL
jgi:hypothetical protein